MPAYSGPDSDLAPDGATMLAHLRYWFEFSERGEIELGYRDAASGKLNKFERFSLDDFQEAVAWACQANLVPGQDLYYRAATLRPTLERHDTADADVMEAPGAWADQDTPEQVAAAWNAPKDITWTASVVTGRTPHMRVQLLVRTERPIGDPVLIRQLNGRAQALFGGDPTVVNPSRLMRLGGSIAWPWKPDRVPELTEFRLNRELSRSRYPIDTLRARLPPLTNGYAHTWEGGKATWEGGKATWEGGKATWEGGKPSPINPIHGRFVRDRVAELTEELHTPGRWHNSMIRIVAIWVSQHLPDETILHASEQWTQPGYSHEQTRAQVAKAIAGARRKAAPGGPWEQPEQPDPKPGGAPQETPPATDATDATPLSTIDLDTIPPRQWVYGRELVASFVSVLAGSGGAGKTAYTFPVGLSIATGRPLLGDGAHRKVWKRGPVWWVNLEDPLDEMRRRLKAAMLHYRIAKRDIDDSVYMDSGRDREFFVAVRDARNNLIVGPQVDAAIAEIGRRGIRLLIVDPFVLSHQAEENRNEEIAFVMRQWGRVASEAGCAVWLVHHFRKGGTGGDIDSARGAVALIGAARAAFTLAHMTADEAARLGIPDADRWQYVRHDNGKANMAPPPKDATWLRLVSVQIGNATAEYPDGDAVQAVERWQPPSPWEGLGWDKIDEILAAIEAGPEPGEYWTASNKSETRWVGIPIMKIGGKAEKPAAAIQAAWLENGVLSPGMYHSPGQRRSIPCVRVDAARAAEMRLTRNAPEDLGDD